MKKCSNCGRSFEDSHKFCSSCGLALVDELSPGQAINQPQYSQPAIQTNLNPKIEKASFSFNSNRYGDTTPTVTEIDALQNILTLTQYKKFIFFKYGRKTVKFDINAISNINTQTKLNLINIFWCILAALGTLGSLLNGSIIWTLIWLVSGLIIYKTMLRKRFIFINYANGSVKIPEERTNDNDMEPLLDYIRKYNPNCIHIEQK